MGKVPNAPSPKNRSEGDCHAAAPLSPTPFGNSDREYSLLPAHRQRYFRGTGRVFYLCLSHLGAGYRPLVNSPTKFNPTLQIPVSIVELSGCGK